MYADSDPTSFTATVDFSIDTTYQGEQDTVILERLERHYKDEVDCPEANANYKELAKTDYIYLKDQFDLFDKEKNNLFNVSDVYYLTCDEVGMSFFKWNGWKSVLEKYRGWNFNFYKFYVLAMKVKTLNGEI